jgi:bis(5'-nucleosyl)-tetraphosphatase (symmetrical)
MKRRLFIGDIQGCREELERLLEKARFDPVTDQLHPVGDLVNRGPDSLGVVRLLRSLDAGGVLGNHDLHALGIATGRRKPRKNDTLEEFLGAEDHEELHAWLAGLPLLRVWDDLYLVHAGLHPRWRDPAAVLDGVDPRDPDSAARFAVTVRYCTGKGRLPERDDVPPPPPFRPWHAFYDREEHAGRRVVFGHWAVQGLCITQALCGLDTACVWGGKLTAWSAEEDRLFQVEAKRTYSPIGG